MGILLDITAVLIGLALIAALVVTIGLAIYIGFTLFRSHRHGSGEIDFPAIVLLLVFAWGIPLFITWFTPAIFDAIAITVERTRPKAEQIEENTLLWVQDVLSPLANTPYEEFDELLTQTPVPTPTDTTTAVPAVPTVTTTIEATAVPPTATAVPLPTSTPSPSPVPTLDLTRWTPLTPPPTPNQ